MSSSSGLPLWLTRGVDPGVFFTVESRVDRADAALDEWDKKNPHEKRKPGTTRFVIAVDSQGEPLDYGGVMRDAFRMEAEIEEEFESTLEELGFNPDELDEDELPIERKRPAGGYDPSEYGD